MNSAHNYLSLRTFRKSGSAVDTPVWFASTDDQTHYLFSAANAGKVKRIRNGAIHKGAIHNGAKAQIASCDMRGSSLGTWEDCSAALVVDDKEIKLAYQRLTAKYGWQMRMLDFFSSLSGRIHHRQVIRLEAA
jgi:PPOX class probable F420-dependent enzyme